MVQYIHTPWRDRTELLAVRHQLYSVPTGTATTAITSSPFAAAVGFNGSDNGAEIEQRQHAVSRIAMWVQRGSCPHMVESTGLLMAAILDDLHEVKKGGSTSAVRLAYSAAFSRYVYLS